MNDNQETNDVVTFGHYHGPRSMRIQGPVARFVSQTTQQLNTHSLKPKTERAVADARAVVARAGGPRGYVSQNHLSVACLSYKDYMSGGSSPAMFRIHGSPDSYTTAECNKKRFRVYARQPVQINNDDVDPALRPPMDMDGLADWLAAGLNFDYRASCAFAYFEAGLGALVFPSTAVSLAQSNATEASSTAYMESAGCTWLAKEADNIDPMPVFTSSSRIGDVWNVPVSSLSNSSVLEALRITGRVAQRAYADCGIAAEAYVLSNGTDMGALQRLSEATLMADDLIKKVPISIRLGLHQKLTQRIPGRLRPMRARIMHVLGISGGAKTLNDVYDLCSTTERGDSNLRVVLDSDSGLSYQYPEILAPYRLRRLVRRDTIVSDVMTGNWLVANAMMYDILSGRRAPPVTAKMVDHRADSAMTAELYNCFWGPHGEREEDDIKEKLGQFLARMSVSASDVQNLKKDFFPRAIGPIEMSILKLKYEVTEAAKLRSKTRQIWVYNAPAQVPLSKFCKFAANSLNGARIRSSEGEAYANPSLFGFNAFYTGLDDLLSAGSQVPPHLHCGIDDPATAFKIYFYSDNVYVLDIAHAEWISMDVKKMEATSTVEEATEVMDALFFLVASDSLKGTALRDLLVYTGANMSHNSIGVRDSTVYATPGLGSGSQTTFLNNHLRMASTVPLLFQYILQLRQKHGPHLRIMDVFKAAGAAVGDVLPGTADYGIPFLIEITSSSNPDPRIGPFRLELGEVASINGAITACQHARPSYDDFGAIVRLDLLGFDATVIFDESLQRPLFIACLSYDRLMRALMFRKGDLTESLEGNPSSDDITGEVRDIVRSCISYGTLLSLNLTGGYAYATANAAIRASGATLAHQLWLSYTKLGYDDHAGGRFFKETLEPLLATTLQPLDYDLDGTQRSNKFPSIVTMVSAVCQQLMQFGGALTEADLRRRIDGTLTRRYAIEFMHDSLALARKKQAAEESEAADRRAKRPGPARPRLGERNPKYSVTAASMQGDEDEDEEEGWAPPPDEQPDDWDQGDLDPRRRQRN